MKLQNGNIIFDAKPHIASYASVVGKKEGEGPLRETFDRIIHDSYAGKDSFEQAESELMNTAVRIAVEKGGMQAEDISVAFCGDLLNQCVASSFAMRSYDIPYAGIYGACSTMGLGLIMSAVATEGGAAQTALCGASSHYCTAERQYRFPLEYGSQRPPTAQWTVTGSGVCIVSAASARQSGESVSVSGSDRSAGASSAHALHIAAARIGVITDFNIKDQNNMGAAMAPAVVKIGTKFFYK